MTNSLFSRKYRVRKTRLSEAILVGCPLLFSGFVALYSRHYMDGYQVRTSTAQQEARVLAYAPFVRDQQTLFSKSAYGVDHKNLLALANRWVAAADNGTLQPLEKVSFDDSLQQGVRGQIFRSESAIVSALYDDAANIAANGHSDEAAKEVLTAVKLSESLKYSDFNSVFLSSVEERRAANFFARNSNDLSRDTKQQAREVFGKVTSNFANLDALTKQSRALYYEWAGRINKNPVSLEDVQRTAMITNEIALNPASPKALFYVRHSILDSQEDYNPVYLSELRMAWRSEKSNQAAFRELVHDM